LLSTVLFSDAQTTVEPRGPINSTPGKGGNDATMRPTVRWLELINERDGPITLDKMRRASINSVFTIIYNTNNKDILDIANWVPCILRKVCKEQFEILDRNEEDKLDEDLDWDGDDGLLASWNMYYKNSTIEFVNSIQLELEETTNNMETHDVSPKRGSLCKTAAENVQKKADSVRAVVLKKSPSQVFKTANVVLVPLNNVDRTKVDGANLAGVVVSISKLASMCRVAVKQGLLNRAYAYHVLKPVPEGSNNLDAMDLRDAFENWRSLPKVTEREAARFILLVGSQGIIHCNCRGSCTTNSCSCKKACRLCSSRCHRNSKCCKNMHDV
jgi:hypothetical protein